MLNRKVIFFELNEVPFRIIDDYCQKHPDSCLARNLPKCYQYKTYAEDSVLSPWITWPTVHRGVPATQHTIHHFGQNLAAIDREFPPIWEILSRHTIKTGIFGSLHTYPLPTSFEGYAFYVPDSFATSSECFPTHLSVFQAFNLALARNSARNVSTQVPIKASLQLLRQLPNLGLRVSTLMDVAQQVGREQIKPWQRNRRRTYQAVLAFDLFLKQLKTTKPDFATFFTNHVASSMHRYWAATFPDDYATFGYGSDWVSRYKGEINFAMHKFDKFLAQLVRFVDTYPEYTLWIVSGMGQAATTAKPVMTQLNLTDANKFMQALGIPSDAWVQSPAMFPYVDFSLQEPWIEVFRSQLKKLIIENEPVGFEEKAGGFFAVYLGHVNLPEKNLSYAVLDNRTLSLEELGLENVIIEDLTNVNAYHVPEGSLLVYDPLHSSLTEKRTEISSLEIAPVLLQNFSVPIPHYMAKPIKIAAS